MDKKRLAQLRANAYKPEFNEAMVLLRREAEEASRIVHRIGANEYGEWMHQYYCKDDGSRLQFDWSQPKSHFCPTCSAAWSGEPFDSAWTSIVHVQIGRAVYHSSLLYTIESDVRLLKQAKSFLLSYASHYEGYRIHGDIPYNGPGKLFAQTLDEAHWIIDLAMGYDLIREHLSLEEEAHIRIGLLQPCARFLIAHKEEQIHNHSVLITSAIASIGLLLDDEDIVQAGLEGEYGLFDQINRGLFEDGLWYEGNAQYHFYAFKSLLNYALMAEGTLLDIYNYRALKLMFDYPLHLVLSDGTMPSLNDGGPRDGIGTFAPFYEIALDIYGDEIYRTLLNTAYGTESKDPSFIGIRTVPRDSLFALLFGRELAAAGKQSESLWTYAYRNVSLPASGLTKLVNCSRWQVLVKHSKFGGEHDHMDRLGLSVVCGDIPLMIDPGTTAYGVPVHYGWFKHTYSHNTVSLNGADQPPSDGRIVQLKEVPWGVWMETAVDWKTDSYTMRDRIILPPELCPWDEEAYKGAEIRRINVLADDHFLDIVSVTLAGHREVHLTNHISGMLADSRKGAWRPSVEKLSELDQKWLKEKRKLAPDEGKSFVYQMRRGTLQQLSWCSKSADTFTALTPNNPPNTNRTSLIHRAAAEDNVLFVQAFSYDSDKDHVVELFQSCNLQVTEQPEGRHSIEFTCSGLRHCYDLELHEDGSIFDKIESKTK
ncbi:heparinase II/III family protein [Cohnella sp.]|uniref:heparinase II/III domain-containing protein n=1 Tax=Cohnella sp. TaxID=1883426 RepID=UPI0035629D4E